MNAAISVEGTSSGKKRYSPVFLAVFTVFLVATAICTAGMLLGVLSAQPTHHDTQWFWAAGHLLVHGHNPYDREAIRQIEIAMGLPVKGMVPITLNPPYTLFLMVPIGLLGTRAAVVVWSLFLAVCLAFSIRNIQRSIENSYERGYLLLAWFFAPALCCIEMGQTGLIVLLGLALFLRFNEQRPFWAGAALSLCAVKPHLLLPFGIVLLAWVAMRKRWWILVGGAATIAAETFIAMALDHAIWSHYRAMIHTERFVDEFIPTISEWMRYLIDRKALWLEFVPAVAAAVWTLSYFFRNRNNWDWRTHGSLLTLVSLVVAPYAWFTDQVVALPAILFVLLGANKPRRGSVTVLLAIMSVTAVEMVTVSSLFFKPDMFLSVAWLGWYLFAMSRGPETDLPLR